MIEKDNDFLKDVFDLADKRDQSMVNVKHCPKCNTDQVQLINWDDGIECKCRHCKNKWRINE